MDNLFISTTFVPDGTPIGMALDICSRNGINAVELGSNHPYEENFKGILNKYQFNYLVHNYFPIPKNSFVLNIASFNDNIKKRSIEHIFKAIEFCDKIGAKLYTFHPGFITDPLGSNHNSKNYDFRWDNDKVNLKHYEKAIDLMLKSVSSIIKYAERYNVAIAVETEGSFYKKEHLLMQNPREYERFIKEFSKNDIGINLNVGHLNLASKALGFEIEVFFNTVADYIIALELSHNNGFEDQHLPLKRSEFYWDIIFDDRLDSIPKILEYRNTKIEEIIQNLNLFESDLNL